MNQLGRDQIQDGRKKGNKGEKGEMEVLLYYEKQKQKGRREKEIQFELVNSVAMTKQKIRRRRIFVPHLALKPLYRTEWESKAACEGKRKIQFRPC